jgi:dTDP-glucose 4,6-dehydratase
MTRVLITGVGGSIGCHVLRHILKETDWDVVGIDSFRHRGLTDRVYAVTKKHPETHHRVKIYTHDLCAPISSLLDTKIGHIDYIINLASISDVEVSIMDPTAVIQANTAIAANMFEFAGNQAIKTFLHVSTDEVYGPTDGKTSHPEWSPIVPSNPYSASKACQEAIATCYWRTYGVPLVIVNIMNNFGEMQSPAKFPAICQRKIRAGQTVFIHQGQDDSFGSRFYLHSRNAADAMLFLLNRPTVIKHTPGCIDRPARFNIVGERKVNNLEMAELIAEYIGKPLRYEKVSASESRPGHDLHYGLDGTLLSDLGWCPPHSFEWSLRNTVQWYERNPQWLTLE